jgi:hypothetical protein
LKFRTLAVCTLIFALGLPVFAADAPEVKPGKWEWTMQMEIPGMPFKMPPIKMNHCIKAEDLKSAVPVDPKQSKDCKISDPEVSGNTVRWSMDCPKQKMTGTGEITYSNDSMTGAMKMVTDGNESSIKYSGKYLGSCEK